MQKKQKKKEKETETEKRGEKKIKPHSFGFFQRGRKVVRPLMLLP